MVKVLTGEKLLLSCYGTVCKGAVSDYSSLNINCPSNQYNWSVQGGQILSGQGTNNISVLWNNPINGYGIINLNSHICGEHYCPKLLTVQIPIIDDLLEINGKDTICINKGENYSLPLYGDTYYNWQINPPNGWTKRDNNGANDISLYFNSPGTYTLSAQYKCEFLNCGEYTTKIKNIVVKDSLQITGKEKICLSLTDSFYLNQNINALWEVYFLSTDSLIYSQQSNNLIFDFPTDGQYIIKARHPNYCNTAEFIVEVINPPNPPTIGEIPLMDTIEVCKYSSTKLIGITDNPRYSFVWETTCQNANPTNYSGNEVTITFADSVCDVKVYKYGKLLGCKSQRFYTQHIK